jgi:hypothetical protein
VDGKSDYAANAIGNKCNFFGVRNDETVQCMTARDFNPAPWFIIDSGL